MGVEATNIVWRQTNKKLAVRMLIVFISLTRYFDQIFLEPNKKMLFSFAALFLFGVVLKT
jgi:hypothetical protein